MRKGTSGNFVKTHRGHEGEPLRQGNIYIDNKKVGFYSDGDWGGPAEVHFDNAGATAMFEERMTAYYAENPSDFEGAEWFFADVLELVELEKIYKKNAKKGLPITAVFEFRPRNLTGEARFAPYKQEQIWSCPSEASLTKLIEKEKPVLTTIIRTPHDLVK